MTNPLQTPFAAVFQAEVLVNSKRIAPYALMLVFAAYAVLLWGWGPAVGLGWATNSDYNILRNLQGFSFLALPIFNSVIMSDPVIRDFRVEIDPLIFSKPISRLSYLLGKFLGSFFVLVCCQAAFPLTLFVLQAFRRSNMVVQPVQVLPYFKHFLFFVVGSQLVLTAVYFTVGTLTRNAKIAYGLAVCFYPLYISYGVFLLKDLPLRWRMLLDPMLLDATLPGNGFLHRADFLNQYVVRYTPDMIANRALLVVVAAACLTFLYFRFVITEPEKSAEISVLNLSSAAERLSYDPETLHAAPGAPLKSDAKNAHKLESAPLPEVAQVNEGYQATLRKLAAATLLELRLLRSENSLIVFIPLAVLLSFLSLPFSAGVSEVSYSASFASYSTNGVLLFLLGVTVFYTGEAMHRDREVRVEPVLWSMPASNSVLLLSKFLSTLLLALLLLVLVGLTAILTQLLRGQTPIEISTYLIAYSVILVPSIAFVGAFAIALNILLRDKYVTYTVSIAAGLGLFYLYSWGYNHWSYNPALYGLWTESDLNRMPARLLPLRAYWLGLTIICLLIAHVGFRRKTKGRCREF
jgi:ABC-2 type transport system permease protein